jgi:flagellar protein FlbD
MAGFTTSRDALMIVVTRLNDSHFATNPDLIERITANPDTTLIMVDGAKYIVTESMSDLIERISRYRATPFRCARGRSDGPHHNHRQSPPPPRPRSLPQ